MLSSDDPPSSDSKQQINSGELAYEENNSLFGPLGDLPVKGSENTAPARL